MNKSWQRKVKVGAYEPVYKYRGRGMWAADNMSTFKLLQRI